MLPRVRRMSYGLLSSARHYLSDYSSISSINKAADCPLWYIGKRNFRTFPVSSALVGTQLRPNSSTKFLTTSVISSRSARNMLSCRYGPMLFGLNANFLSRPYSSHHEGKQDGSLSVPSHSTGQASDKAIGNEWVDNLNNGWQSVVDTASSVGEKVKEMSTDVIPYVQQLYESHPYLEKVVVPVGGTLSLAVAAWFIMPRILRKIHKYSVQSPLPSLTGNSSAYDKSLWNALEDPAKYLSTFMLFSQLAVIIAPTTSVYLPQAWRGAVVLSFVWFLNRWKTNFFSSALANQITVGLDRDTLLAFEKASSVGILILGVMALAEACGVAVQSILTVGGIGGVATAFASRDILGNLLSGLSVQFSRPFSIGDNIKAGSVEGQVVEMGLTTTSLISPEMFPVIVPNSLFSSQVIVNKSRAQWRASIIKVPVRIDDLDKIPLISEEIASMLKSKSNPDVFLEKDVPYCYLSQIESSFAELTIGCNLRSMKRHEIYAAKQNILLQAVKIIKKHGAELGSTIDWTIK